MVPEITLSPFNNSCGIDSPVNAFVSTVVEPAIISPSKGIFSPGLIKIISLIFTSLGSTISYLSLIFKFAKSGLISIKEAIDFLDLPTA